MTTKSVWSVYLLVSPRGRSYVGCTTDPNRRLRQHNGEIRGGARSTRKESSWRLVCYVGGFSGRAEAMRFEALVKKRARGVDARRIALCNLYFGICPSSRTGKDYDVPENLTLWGTIPNTPKNNTSNRSNKYV